MRLTATLRIAVRALRRNTLRTLLTMLGIIIGVGAVIAMISIGNGAKARIETQIAASLVHEEWRVCDVACAA